MPDWKTQMSDVRKQFRDPSRVELALPAYFSFKDHDAFNFERALAFFRWDLKDCPVDIDFRTCRSANYQALALVVLYAWHLKSNGCRVDFTGLDERGNGGAADVWWMMGAPGLFSVAFNENQNFRGNEFKPLIAIRNHSDFRLAMEKAGEFSKGFSIEHINTLRYVISELLYNTLEHGIAFFQDKDSWNKRLPSLIQFTWYRKQNEIHFLVGDVGMGVKRHLSQTYPGIEDDEAALQKAIQPQVSGTFGRSDPYQAKNNAGMGLFLSTNIVRRLRADMHIISGNGLLHVSPADITTRRLEQAWPGTLALVTLRLEKSAGFDLNAMMAEFREAAAREQSAKNKAEDEGTFYLSIYNYFGTYPEDKSAAIKYRDRVLLDEVASGKRILLDFDRVESSPHSFLNALLATPIKRLGMAAYKRLKIVNAKPDIRETIDFILEDNTSGDGLDL
nr:STAS-like domain-containing protein [uncultured Caldimonas sp.]